jgi:hypothetical protein
MRNTTIWFGQMVNCRGFIPIRTEVFVWSGSVVQVISLVNTQRLLLFLLVLCVLLPTPGVGWGQRSDHEYLRWKMGRRVGRRCAAASPPEVLEEVRFSSSFPPLRIIQLLPSRVLSIVYCLAVASSRCRQWVIRTAKLRQPYELLRLLRCIFCLRCSTLAFCFSLCRIADEKHMDTSLCRTFVLLFGVCVVKLSVILYDLFPRIYE